MFKLNYKTKKLNRFYVIAYLKARFLPLSRSAKIPGHLTPREGIALHEVAKKYASEGSIVEIGSFLGKSSNFLVEAILKSGHLYCVDTWQNDAMPGGNQDNFEQFLNNMKGWEGKFTPLRGDSNKTVLDWKQQIDLLWIDGDHSYEGCASDIRNWFPFLKTNGWICLHDYANPCGVAQAAQELLKGKVDKYFFVDSIFFG
ncbi:MAG: class I SAM-dependent methyltransferase, partial [Smithella sp.]